MSFYNSTNFVRFMFCGSMVACLLCFLIDDVFVIDHPSHFIDSISRHYVDNDLIEIRMITEICYRKIIFLYI